jgi:glycosyltransferase involved in cell wall biosynthesis
MRIAYVAHASGGSVSGVFHKIVGHVSRWRDAGHEVRLFVLTRDEARVWEAGFDGASVFRYDGPVSRLRAATRLALGVRRHDPEVLYFRYFPFYPPMLLFPRRAAMVVEVNADDTHEYALGSRLRSTYNRVTRDLLLRRARAMVFVTAELRAAPAFGRFRARKEVITNGVDLAAYPELPSEAQGPPALVFVGHPAALPWQGLDKVVRLASLRPAWRFDVVGPGRPDHEPPSNITWHGPLERAELLGVYGRADVGIGTLALHRNALDVASPLKVREYLAVGLPVVYGYRDPDADRLGSHVLRLGNHESNVDEAVDAIDRFVTGSRGRRVPRSAVAHIDVKEKERERLGLFAELVSSQS